MLASIGLIRIISLPLELPPPAATPLYEVLLAALAVALVWGALRSIDVMTGHLALRPWAVERQSARSLLALVARIAKVLVVVIAGIAFLSGIGLPVASLLAGL